jgi:hypothetical protein
MKDERLKIKDRGSQQRRYQRHSAGSVCKEDAVRPLAMKMPTAFSSLQYYTELTKYNIYRYFFLRNIARSVEYALQGHKHFPRP